MKRLLVVMLALMLLSSCDRANPRPKGSEVPEFPPPQPDWPAFTGYILRDESIPEDTPFPEVQVYGVQHLENGGSASVHMLTPIPDEEGKFTFERPAELIDIYLSIFDLPPGVGVVKEPLDREYGLDILEQEYILSAAADLQVSMKADGSLEPYIYVYDAKGRRLNVNGCGTKEEIGRWKDETAGLVEITGVAYLGSGEDQLQEPFSVTVDISGLSEEERTLRLDYWGVTDGVGFDGYANNGQFCTPIPGDMNGNGSNEEILYILFAGVFVMGLVLCFRRKK